MNKWNLIFTGILLSSTAFAGFADVSVKGYYRKDGTYVAPHHRSSPDGDTSNNYSSSKSDPNSKNNVKDEDMQPTKNEDESD